MCPLRIVLIFLSATLAGFFVLRNLKEAAAETEPTTHQEEEEEEETLTPFTKVGSAICSAFWTCVDMASGRYLWRNLVSNNNNKKKH